MDIVLSDGRRVRLGAPLPLCAEVTAAAVADLALAPGAVVWVALKATEVLAVVGPSVVPLVLALVLAPSVAVVLSSPLQAASSTTTEHANTERSRMG